MSQYQDKNAKREEKTRLLVKQNYRCAICRKPFNSPGLKVPLRKQAQVDHNHITGKIRGLLCVNCNNGLGLFKEDRRLLQRAVDYLTGDNGLNYLDPITYELDDPIEHSVKTTRNCG